MNETILRDAFPDWSTGSGIFDEIMQTADMPWKDDENVTSLLLDLEYFGNRSGSKFCSPLVSHYLQNGEVTSTGREKLAEVIVAKYLTPWSRLWLTNVLSYSPTNNYDMTETRNTKKSSSGGEVSTESVSHTGTDTLQHGKVETVDHAKTVDDLVSVYGLNTVGEPKPSTKDFVEEGGSTTTTNSGSDVQTKNLNDSSLVNKNRADAGEENETVHRIGNIGVTTNQKLISEERNLWIWNFFEQVFRDVDKELTLAIFDPCRL